MIFNLLLLLKPNYSYTHIYTLNIMKTDTLFFYTHNFSKTNTLKMALRTAAARSPATPLHSFLFLLLSLFYLNCKYITQ